jgi:hypothetical protein
MSRPGDRLRALASRVFDDETMERLIDPVIADLQVEYAEASRAGLIWRRRWVRTAGYAAVLYVAARTLRVFVGLILALTMLFELPYLLRWQVTMTMARAVSLVPQALIVTVPMALTLAIGFARPSASQARQTLIMTIASGAVCAVFVFVTLAWWVPSANQAFRVSVARELGGSASPPRGVSEMTIGELRQQIKWAASVRADWRTLEFTYHSRWAFPWASLALALLMASLRRRGPTRRAMLLATLPILFGYYVLLFVGREYVLAGALQAALGAWMPNVVTLFAAAAIAMRAARRQVIA